MAGRHSWEAQLSPPTTGSHLACKHTAELGAHTEVLGSTARSGCAPVGVQALGWVGSPTARIALVC